MSSNKSLTVRAPSLPALPSDSGLSSWWHSPADLAKSDAEFCRAHEDLLRARASQAAGATMLADSRKELLLKIAELANIDDLIRHEYQKGTADRAHELRMQTLEHQRKETLAEAEVLRAEQKRSDLSSTTPAIKNITAAAPPLLISDLEKVAQNMPEIKPGTIQSLVWALQGLATEKKT